VLVPGRCGVIPEPDQDRAGAAWIRRVHCADPRLLPHPPTGRLDPGQPLGQPDPRRPCLRREQPDRVRAAADRRQLSEAVEYHFTSISQFVACNADYLDWDAFALARHNTYRNGEHGNRRLLAAENCHRIAA